MPKLVNVDADAEPRGDPSPMKALEAELMAAQKAFDKLIAAQKGTTIEITEEVVKPKKGTRQTILEEVGEEENGELAPVVLGDTHEDFMTGLAGLGY